MKKQTMIALLIGACITLCSCGSKEIPNYLSEYEISQEAEIKSKDFASIAQSDTMELLLNASTGTIRWKNKETGKYVDNRLSEDDITNATALSDVVANFFNGINSKKYNSVGSMDSYSYGIQTDTLKYELIDNGVRFIYKLGSDAVSYKQFPAYISDERMQSLILQYCDKKQAKAVKAQYRQMASGTWARKTNKDNPLSGLAAPQLYQIFYEIAAYNYEELEVDCTQWDTLDELPENQSVEIVMDYYLDGDDLMVRIPTQNIISGTDYPMESIEVLPYMMSSNSKDGYLFVPDGSGALIYFDNDRLTEYQYSSKYYGGDILQDSTTYNVSPTYMALPVYGMKVEDYAVLGIIEKGAEIAQLNTFLSGYYKGIDYTRASLKFYIREAQILDSYVGATNNYTLSKVPTDYYHDDIVVRYCFLSGDNANYAGMAKAYQNNLIKQGQIKQNEREDLAPLFLDLLGEVDKKKYFLGIPYDSSVSLTSFDEASEIINDLSDKGISNIKVLYEGMLNGGINQRALEKVQISSALGGKSDFKKLLQVSNSAGAKIYPGVLLESAYTGKKLSKSERSYTLLGEVAQIYQFNPVTYKAILNSQFPQYVISPNYIADYAKNFASSYKKFGVPNLGSTDFMTYMSADYRNNENVSISSAIPNYKAALNSISEDNSLMLSNPIALAYEKCDYVTNIPMENSGMKVLDAAVPFTQMVLDGCITCASEYSNRDDKSLDETLLKAMEGKSALNFRFIAADTSVLEDTTQNDVFFAEYRLWQDKVVPYYTKYQEFYEAVGDATIVSHEIIDRNNDYRVVTYSNGVKLYLNYSDEAAQIDGKTINALSYVIEEGGKSNE